MGTTVTDNDVAVREGIGLDTGLEGQWQVVLWNDDVNEMGYVVRALMSVFGHNRRMSTRFLWKMNHVPRPIHNESLGGRVIPQQAGLSRRHHPVEPHSASAVLTRVPMPGTGSAVGRFPRSLSVHR